MGLLDIVDLHAYFYANYGVVKAVDGANLTINVNETLGLVGESGCGKSTIALSVLRLLSKSGKIVSGKILFEGRNLLDIPEQEMREVRGRDISMIFQDPMVSLNPVFTILDQVSEPIRLHQKVEEKEIPNKAIDILRKVRIADAETVARSYPHQLSGGMRQRVMIAIAVSCNPRLLIADEPTTSLDVTIQAQILDLMRTLKKEFKSSILLITHDLGVIFEMADKVAVMYAGRVVEYSDVTTILTDPKHPYTEALLKSFPSIGRKAERLSVILGRVPSLYNLPLGCRFRPRCPRRKASCSKKDPELVEFEPGHFVACHEYAGCG